MPAPALSIPSRTGDQIAQRLLALFPQSWVSDAELTPGGVLYGLVATVGDLLSKALVQETYAQHTTRLATAQDVALDTWAQDLFGSTLTRAPGEMDAGFRKRLQLAVFRPAVTRAALASALVTLTGVPARLGEPWSPADTGAWDYASFWDYDTPAIPFRWGSPELRYQGFVDAVRPVTAQAGVGALYGWDLGSGWDSFSGWRSPDAAWILGDTLVYTAINAVRPFGTIVWVKFVSPAALVGAPGALAMDFLGDF